MTPKGWQHEVEIFITALGKHRLKWYVMPVQKCSMKRALKGNGMRSYWNSQESEEEFTDLQRQGTEPGNRPLSTNSPLSRVRLDIANSNHIRTFYITYIRQENGK